MRSLFVPFIFVIISFACVHCGNQNSETDAENASERDSADAMLARYGTPVDTTLNTRNVRNDSVFDPVINLAKYIETQKDTTLSNLYDQPWPSYFNGNFALVTEEGNNQPSWDPYLLKISDPGYTVMYFGSDSSAFMEWRGFDGASAYFQGKWRLGRFDYDDQENKRSCFMYLTGESFLYSEAEDIFERCVLKEEELIIYRKKRETYFGCKSCRIHFGGINILYKKLLQEEINIVKPRFAYMFETYAADNIR